MSVTKSQKRRFIEQACRRCDSQRCDFPLERREDCPRWIKFEKAVELERNKEE